MYEMEIPFGIVYALHLRKTKDFKIITRSDNYVMRVMWNLFCGD